MVVRDVANATAFELDCAKGGDMAKRGVPAHTKVAPSVALSDTATGGKAGNGRAAKYDMRSP